MNRDEPNDDALEQATTLLRDVPLPAFPADAIAKQMRARLNPILHSTVAPMRIRRVSWVSRIAASIAIFAGLLAVGWAMFRSNPVIAFAVAADRLHDVHALGADLIINSDGMELHGTIGYAVPGRFRVTVPGAAVEILDINVGKLLLLNSLDKSATVLNLDDAPSDLKRQELDWIEKLRNVSRDAGKPIGVATINGVRAMEFSIMDDGQEMFVWADAATGQPIRIEAKLVNGKNAVSMTLDHLTINPPIDEKQFSVNVPPGFKTQSGHVSAAAISEDDLIRFFREYVARTGSFPPSLIDFPRSLERMVTGTTRSADSGPDASFFETVTRATRALLFINQLPPTSDWHYAGVSAHVGEASQPIFWYRAAGAKNYRVIHADFAVEETATPPAVAGAETPTFQR